MLIQCPKCGYSGKLPDDSTARKIRCSQCGATFRTGQPDPLDVPMVVADDPAPALNIVVADDGPEPARAVRDLGEPWYYWFLEMWGKLFVLLAILAAVIYTLVFLAMQVRAAAGSGAVRSPLDSPAGAMLGSVWLFVFVFLPVIIAWLTIAAVILLLVDQARNIRRLRLISERGSR